MGFFKRYWPMQEGGPYDSDKSSNKIFKCTDCGSETHHRDGYNGEPDPGQCSNHCSSRASDWRPGRVSRRFTDNLERVRMSSTPLAETGRDVDPKKTSRDNYGKGYDAIRFD